MTVLGRTARQDCWSHPCPALENTATFTLGIQVVGFGHFYYKLGVQAGLLMYQPLLLEPAPSCSEHCPCLPVRLALAPYLVSTTVVEL